MSIPKSRFKKCWVLILFSGDEGWCEGYVRKMTYEAGQWAYEVMWKDGEIEPVFPDSISRIRHKHPRMGKKIDFEKRRLKRLRVV